MKLIRFATKISKNIGNGVGSDHIVEIALDGIENEELRDPKMRF